MKLSNYLLIALTAIAFIACSSKGNSNVKLLESMTIKEEGGRTYTQKFEYDDKNRIVKILDNNQMEVLEIIYDGDDIVLFGAQWGGANVERKGNTLFTSSNDNSFTITLNDDGTIAKDKSENPDYKSVKHTNYHYQGGNLIKMENVRTMAKEKNEWSYEFKYDTKKSPFSCNTPRWFLHWYFMTGFDNNIVEHKASYGTIITYKYKYDRDGFPTKKTKTETRSDGTKTTTTTTFTYRDKTSNEPHATKTEIDEKKSETVENTADKQGIDLTEILKNEIDFIGIIGDEMQKMGIVFLTIVRKTDTEYEVTGKSKVRDNICDFRGIIEVEQAGEEFFDGHVEGAVSGRYKFYEDRNQSASGEFEGTFHIQWGGNTNTIFDVGKRHSAEIEANFRGNWTSYRTGAKRIVRFGNSQWLLPGDFNDGQEYIRAENYRSIGWGSYFDRQEGDNETQEKAEREYRAEWVRWWK